MNGKNLIVLLLCVTVHFGLFASASAEGGGSNRGSYLSSGGYILLPEDIFVEAYIAERDYNYPLPQDEELNITTATGKKDGLEYVLLGLKGKKIPFENVPPLNISFCIDRSGSMSEVMPWVHASFYIFIDSMRIGDIVSLVDMDTEAQVLIPPMKIQSEEDRRLFKDAVDKIYADGATDVYSGIKKSYEQIELNDTSEYLNRVIILTDGMHNFGKMINNDIVDLAIEKRKKGINISTIMLGVQAAVGLMTDVAKHGGGSSRFISNHDEMVKIFETELDRMLIPVAREVKIQFELKDGVTLKNTWGYQNNQEGNIINYFLPTLHNGDYETIFSELEIDKTFEDSEIGTFFITYVDLDGNEKELGSYTISKSHDEDDEFIEDERVREIEGILSYTNVLTNIAEKTLKISALESELYNYSNPSAQRDDVVGQIRVEIQQNLQLIERIRTYLMELDTSLGGGVYDKYYTLLDNYQQTFEEAHDSYNRVANKVEE